MTLWRKSFIGFLILVIFVMFAPVIKANAADSRDIPTYSQKSPDAAISAPDAPANQMASSVVWVATDHIYAAKKDDNLTHIAKLFNVPLDELFSFNPDIKNKHLIRIGQKIHIPRFRREAMPLNDVPDFATVVLAKSDLVKLIDQRDRFEARTKELEADNAMKNNFQYLMYVAIFTLALALIIVGSTKRTATKPRNNSKADAWAAIASLPGWKLAELLDETLVIDEHGNPVALKNAKDFLANEKRAYLRDKPVHTWELAMNVRKAVDAKARGASGDY
ncbi:MAG: LysM domain-containing protein [Candidatus Sungiibacteriota bacterium]